MKRKTSYKGEKDFQKDYMKALRESGFRAYKIPDEGYSLKPFDITACKDGYAYAIELKYGDVNTYEKIYKMLRPNQVGGLAAFKEHGGKSYIVGRDNEECQVYKYEFQKMSKNNRSSL